MFKKYDKYKDTGIKYIGKIPQNWDLLRIKDYTYLKGRIGWQGLRNDDFLDNGNYYCVTGTDFSNGKIDWKNCYFVDKFRYEQDKFIQLRENDLLITKDGSIGKIALIYDLPKKTTLNSGVFVSRPLKNKYNNYYLYWLLYSKVFTDFIDEMKNGSTIQHLYQNVFERFIYCLPGDYEQKLIADYLKESTLKIDETIELLEAKKNNYLELRQRVIFEAVTKGLNKASFKDSGINWVGDIPENWYKDRLKNIFNERSVRNLDKQTGEPITTNILSVMKDIGVINHRDKGLVGNKMSEDITGYKIVHPNDIVVNKMNVIIGSVGISKEFGALSVVYIILITKADCSPRYYDYVFRVKAFQKSLRKIATGILEIREAVNMNLFKGLELPKPPKEEQIEIANYLDEKTSKIDEIVKTIDENIDRLKEYKKVLINDTVTGKIKVI
ncbi:restriction endonuclease subunit S [Candidatus Gracilibacteria bacterium]|nr:restriction endonuclease subunit S [Candidatus Gracilibacteria bacterium]